MTSIIIADANDAITVLKQGNLHNSGGEPNNAVLQLELGIQQMTQANQGNKPAIARQTLIDTARTRFQAAVAIMKS